MKIDKFAMKTLRVHFNTKTRGLLDDFTIWKASFLPTFFRYWDYFCYYAKLAEYIFVVCSTSTH